MAVTPNSVVTPQAINTSFMSFVNADGTTVKDLFTAGANGAILNSLVAQSTDGTTRNLKLYYYDGTTAWPLGTVNIAVSSGNTGAIASTNLLSTTLIPGLPLDQNGNPFIKLEATHKIQGSVLVAVTAAAQVTTLAFGEDL